MKCAASPGGTVTYCIVPRYRVNTVSARFPDAPNAARAMLHSYGNRHMLDIRYVAHVLIGKPVSTFRDMR